MTLALSPYLTPIDTSRDDLFYLTAGFQAEDGGVINYSVFREDDLEALKGFAPTLQNLAVYTTGYGDTALVYGGKRFAFDPQTSVTVSPSYLELSPLTMTRGNAFSRADAGEAVVLLSDDSAKHIFGDAEPMGRTLLKVQSGDGFYTRDLPHMNPILYRIIGTFAETPNALNATPRIIFPAWAPEDFYADGSFSQLLLQARSGQSEVAKAQSLAAVRQQYRDNPLLRDAEVGQDFFVSSVADFANDQAPFNPNLVILALFGVVSFIIGSVGLFSTTLVEVLERTHEIGLKRALGASRGVICREFVTEAVNLSFIGAVLGTGFAALLSYALAEPLGDAFFYGLRFTWAWNAAVLVVVAGVTLGALVSFVPVFNATQPAPVDSLKNVSGSA